MKISRPIKADLALIAITFVWGSTFTVVKESLTYASPLLFISLRFWIATIVLIAFMPGQILKISGKSLGRGLMLSVVLFGGFVFQTLGLRSTSPSHSAFITGLSVLFVPLLGLLFYRHKPRPQTLAGIVLATLGLFLLLVDMDDLRIRPGDVLTLICAVFFAFQILFLGRFVSSTDYRHLLLMQIGGTAFFSTIMIPFLETPFVIWNSKLIFFLCITGICATAFALYVQAHEQRFTTANRAALIFSLEPFFAALFAYWILGQVLTIKEWVGGALVLAGILISELRSASRGLEEEQP
jgi:drug/metabolite transporter (DMT)-like permease